MTNNDVLRRLRYTFDFSDKNMVALFATDPLSSAKLSVSGLKARLLDEEDDAAIICTDQELAAFLDGLIVSKRGLREPQPSKNAGAKESAADLVEFRLSKNDILKKLRIALNFKEQDMLESLKLGGTEISKSELSAFFRKPDHKHFRTCGNQVLRNFIKGVTAQLRA